MQSMIIQTKSSKAEHGLCRSFWSTKLYRPMQLLQIKVRNMTAVLSHCGEPMHQMTDIMYVWHKQNVQKFPIYRSAFVRVKLQTNLKVKENK